MTNRIIAREGGIVYTRRGDDVYCALGGLPRYYCCLLYTSDAADE